MQEFQSPSYDTAWSFSTELSCFPVKRSEFTIIGKRVEVKGIVAELDSGEFARQFGLSSEIANPTPLWPAISLNSQSHSTRSLRERCVLEISITVLDSNGEPKVTYSLAPFPQYGPGLRLAKVIDSFQSGGTLLSEDDSSVLVSALLRATSRVQNGKSIGSSCVWRGRDVSEFTTPKRISLKSEETIANLIPSLEELVSNDYHLGTHFVLRSPSFPPGIFLKYTLLLAEGVLVLQECFQSDILPPFVSRNLQVIPFKFSGESSTDHVTGMKVMLQDLESLLSKDHTDSIIQGFNKESSVSATYEDDQVFPFPEKNLIGWQDASQALLSEQQKLSSGSVVSLWRTSEASLLSIEGSARPASAKLLWRFPYPEESLERLYSHFKLVKSWFAVIADDMRPEALLRATINEMEAHVEFPRYNSSWLPPSILPSTYAANSVEEVLGEDLASRYRYNTVLKLEPAEPTPNGHESVTGLLSGLQPVSVMFDDEELDSHAKPAFFSWGVLQLSTPEDFHSGNSPLNLNQAGELAFTLQTKLSGSIRVKVSSTHGDCLQIVEDLLSHLSTQARAGRTQSQIFIERLSTDQPSRKVTVDFLHGLPSCYVPEQSRAYLATADLVQRIHAHFSSFGLPLPYLPAEYLQPVQKNFTNAADWLNNRESFAPLYQIELCNKDHSHLLLQIGGDGLHSATLIIFSSRNYPYERVLAAGHGDTFRNGRELDDTTLSTLLNTFLSLPEDLSSHLRTVGRSKYPNSKYPHPYHPDFIKKTPLYQTIIEFFGGDSVEYPVQRKK